jgi:hypothetical protein
MSSQTFFIFTTKHILRITGVSSATAAIVCNYVHELEDLRAIVEVERHIHSPNISTNVIKYTARMLRVEAKLQNIYVRNPDIKFSIRNL